jgi:hypothetical protein
MLGYVSGMRTTRSVCVHVLTGISAVSYGAYCCEPRALRLQ